MSDTLTAYDKSLLITKNRYVAGVAAKLVKRRFPEKIANALQDLAWWEWEHERLRVALQDFRALGAEAFVEKYASV